MVSLVAIIIWRVNVLVVFIFFLVFAALDGVYLSAALIKVPAGAWFTLLLAAILSCIFVLWRYGKEQQWTSEAQDRIPPSHFMTFDPKSSNSSSAFLTAAYGSHPVTTVPSVGIFFDKVGDQLPIVFTQFVRKFCATPEIIIFLHLRPLSVPHVPDTERYVIQRTSIPSCYRITIRHGYTDDIITPSIGPTLISQLILFITRDPTTFTGLQSCLVSQNPSIQCSTESSVESPIQSPIQSPQSTSQASSVIHTPAIQAELDKINNAAMSQMVYVLGKEQMKIRKGGRSLQNWLRRAVLWTFLWIRDNSRGKMADLDLPVEGLVEVGFVKEI